MLRFLSLPNASDEVRRLWSPLAATAQHAISSLPGAEFCKISPHKRPRPRELLGPHLAAANKIPVAMP